VARFPPISCQQNPGQLPATTTTVRARGTIPKSAQIESQPSTGYEIWRQKCTD
jgi:hypothetical protein